MPEIAAHTPHTKITVRVTINGKEHALRVAPAALAIDSLREAGFASVKRGCDEGDCGSCSLLVDGVLMRACLLYTAQLHDREVTTVEGLGNARAPHPIQQAFVEAGAVQCGYCTPGMILATKALLDQHPDPTDAQIRDGLDGNLCRCTGYVKIFDAVRAAARVLREGGAR